MSNFDQFLQDVLPPVQTMWIREDGIENSEFSASYAWWATVLRWDDILWYGNLSKATAKTSMFLWHKAIYVFFLICVGRYQTTFPRALQNY